MKTTVIIKKNRDFTRMYRRAKQQTGPFLVTYCAKNRLGCNRIGITASKKVGDAVRGRTARCKMQPVREAMRQQIAALTGAPSLQGEVPL